MGGSHETHNIYSNLSATPLNVPLNHQQHFRLNKISEIKDYFVAKIKERELMSKRLGSINLVVTTGSISNASFATVIGALAGMKVQVLVLQFQFVHEL